MNINKTAISAAIGLALGGGAPIAQAALNEGTTLKATAGVGACLLGGTYPDSCTLGLKTVASGSWFGMDGDGNGSISATEKTPITGRPDSTTIGIIVGQTATATGSHSGPIDGTENPAFDIWEYFGGTGMDYLDVPITEIATGDPSQGLDLSGWTVTWNGIPDIPMGGDAANFGTTDLDGDGISNGPGDLNSGIAKITCSSSACAVGDTFTLDYAAQVPKNDPSGFGGVMYTLRLEGTISLLEISDDSFDVLPNTATDLDVTNNDGDVNPTSVEIVNSPGNGTATVNSDGTITYTPNSGASSDSFTYRVRGNAGNWSAGPWSTVATVSINITATPPPFAGDVSVETETGAAVSIDVLANTSDPDGQVVASTLTIVSSPANGSLGSPTNGTVVYTPESGFAGEDSFTFTVKDNDGKTSNEATVTISVIATAPATNNGTFAPGSKAVDAGKTSGGGLTPSDIGVEDIDAITQSCVGGCFDFVVSGITPGGLATVVLPLSEPVPESTQTTLVQYRKVLDGEWVPFQFTSEGDAIQSAAGNAGQCPPPGDSAYGQVTAGHYCLQLTIKDGGQNDADGVENGTVVDPGGLAIRNRAESATSGCTIARSPADLLKHAEWWLLGGLLALLGMRRRKA